MVPQILGIYIYEYLKAYISFYFPVSTLLYVGENYKLHSWCILARRIVDNKIILEAAVKRNKVCYSCHYQIPIISFIEIQPLLYWGIQNHKTHTLNILLLASVKFMDL
jgi:hypothetical protein